VKVSRPVLIKGTLALSLVLVIVLAGYWWDIVSPFHPDRIQGILGKAGNFAPFLHMVMMALAVVVSPIPSVPLDVAAGIFFGPLRGTLYSAIGALGGAVASFLIARFLGRQVIEQFLGGHINFCTVVILGLVIVFLLFVFPALIERYNLFSLRTFFEHTD